jgi:hypothetical protein
MLLSFLSPKPKPHTKLPLAKRMGIIEHLRFVVKWQHIPSYNAAEVESLCKRFRIHRFTTQGREKESQVFGNVVKSILEKQAGKAQSVPMEGVAAECVHPNKLTLSKRLFLATDSIMTF